MCLPAVLRDDRPGAFLGWVSMQVYDIVIKTETNQEKNVMEICRNCGERFDQKEVQDTIYDVCDKWNDELAGLCFYCAFVVCLEQKEPNPFDQFEEYGADDDINA